MSGVEVTFGFATAAVLVLSWRKPDARAAAVILAAIWLIEEPLSRVSWVAADCTGQALNVAGGLAAFLIWRGLPSDRKLPSAWLLVLTASFGVENLLHLQETHTLAQLQQTSAVIDPWYVYDLKHDLWVDLCALNALQLILTLVGPHVHGGVAILVNLFHCPPRCRRRHPAFLAASRRPRG